MQRNNQSQFYKYLTPESYEKEWRVVSGLRNKSNEYEIIPFNPQELAAVYLGWPSRQHRQAWWIPQSQRFGTEIRARPRNGSHVFPGAASEAEKETGLSGGGGAVGTAAG